MRIGTLEVCLAAIQFTGLALATPSSTLATESPRALPPHVAKDLQEVAAAGPGLSVAVGTEGSVGWAQGFGLADLELGVPVTPDTRFLVYSAAKAWTGAAGARLAERGELDVDQPIGVLLPDLPERLRSVTAMQLALHRAGVRHYADAAEAASSPHCETVSDALPIFTEDPLRFEPGTEQAYSSWGYVLLSAVLEKASGVPFSALLEREVFAPAGMELAVPADPYPIVPGRAEAYARVDDAWRNLPSLDASCKWGAGGYLATPSDLVRFYLALMDGALVDSSFRPLLLQTDEDGLVRFGGVSAGGRSLVLVNPRAGWAIGLTANSRADGVDFDEVATSVAEGLELPLPRRPPSP